MITQIIKSAIKVVLGILIISMCFYGCFMIFSAEPKQVNATVLEHVVVGDRHGVRTYVTIVRTDDGYVQELTGLQHYTKPIGSTFTLKVYR